MSRSCTTFRDSQPFDDGWKEASFSRMAPSDHFHRRFIMETEEQKVPNVLYRYRWSEPLEKFGDYREPVDNRYQPRLPAQKVEEIISKARDEASRGSTGPVTLPTTTTQGLRSDPTQILQENNRKYDDERNSPELYERLGGNEGYVPKTHPLFKLPEHIKDAKKFNTNANNGESKLPKTSPLESTREPTVRSMSGPETYKVETKDYYSESKKLPLSITGRRINGAAHQRNGRNIYSV